MCIWTNTKPSLIVWEAPESPKAQHQYVRWRSFSFLAPSVWNSMPSDLRNSSTLPLFKSRLKTHLFMTTFCSLQSPPAAPPPNSPTTSHPIPHMNVLPECFSCFRVINGARVRVRESAGSGRDGGWGEREYVCMWDKERGRERERERRGEGEVRVCGCVGVLV